MMENNMLLKKGFTELSLNEMSDIDGGFVILGTTIVITTGAKVAIACFGAGVIAGLIFA
jgi:lactobin A/cerein 7B family class IIb bacteriocin